MIEALYIHKKHLDNMRAHVEACMPLEGCGLLAGRLSVVQEVISIPNSAASPTRFRMDPAQQLQAFHRIDEAGQDLLGIFHSHPAEEAGATAGPSGPSPTDVKEAAYPVVHVIWSRTEGRWLVHGFWIDGGRVSTVALRITVGE